MTVRLEPARIKLEGIMLGMCYTLCMTRPSVCIAPSMRGLTRGWEPCYVGVQGKRIHIFWCFLRPFLVVFSTHGFFSMVF
jgi:hypothetical protein